MNEIDKFRWSGDFQLLGPDENNAFVMEVFNFEHMEEKNYLKHSVREADLPGRGSVSSSCVLNLSGARFSLIWVQVTHLRYLNLGTPDAPMTLRNLCG